MGFIRLKARIGFVWKNLWILLICGVQD